MFQSTAIASALADAPAVAFPLALIPAPVAAPEAAPAKGKGGRAMSEADRAMVKAYVSGVAAVNLSGALAALMGDKEEGATMVKGAVSAAVATMAAFGTDAPWLAAGEYVAKVKGVTKLAVALRAGWQAACEEVADLKKGKETADAAISYADAAGDAFMVAASTILTTKVKGAKVDPVKALQAALTRMGDADKVSDAVLRKLIKGNAWRDLVGRVALLSVPATAVSAE